MRHLLLPPRAQGDPLPAGFFSGTFWDFSILSLQKMLLPYAYFLPMGTYRRYSERQLQVRMMDSFSDLFPTYRLLGQEYLLPDGGRVDLLAMEGDRAVLFELKLGNADPTPQLERYARMFQDPILS